VKNTCAPRNDRDADASQQRRTFVGMTGDPRAVSAGRSHCPYCALQCGIRIFAGASGVEVNGRADFPVNEGALCGKGASAGELLRPGLRLTTPMVRDRKGGELRPAGWDEALDLVARELGARRPEAVAVFGGGGLTNEKAYQLGRFARTILRTPNIDYNGRFCMSSAAAAQTRAFGVDRGLPFLVRDLRGARATLLVGANPVETMPPIMRHFSAAGEAGGTLTTVDPRRTRTAQWAERHLQPVPGTDLALALGMLHIAVAEGLVDEDYVAQRTSGFDRARRIATAYWPERVERIAGVPAEAMRRTVIDLAKAARESGGGAMIITARGAEQHSKGVDTVSGWINLALALGLPGRPGSGYGTLTGQGNGQGGREHGQKADQLPGYRRLDDPAARAHVAAVGHGARRARGQLRADRRRVGRRPPGPPDRPGATAARGSARPAVRLHGKGLRQIADGRRCAPGVRRSRRPRGRTAADRRRRLRHGRAPLRRTARAARGRRQTSGADHRARRRAAAGIRPGPPHFVVRRPEP
jgi:assimilatory nitrate reductase catalytic subunit